MGVEKGVGGGSPVAGNSPDAALLKKLVRVATRVVTVSGIATKIAIVIPAERRYFVLTGRDLR